MGLRTILRKLKAKEKEVRVLILGLDNAGKTTVLKRLNGEDITTISPTLGFNIKTIEHRGFKMNMWDVGGQKSLRAYWKNYFESTEAIIWVVDSADRRRLQNCRDELHAIVCEEKLLGATLLVFANKQDLPGALPLDEIKTALELEDINHLHWSVLPCSAFTGENLVQGIDWMLDSVATRLFLRD